MISQYGEAQPARFPSIKVTSHLTSQATATPCTAVAWGLYKKSDLVSGVEFGFLNENLLLLLRFHVTSLMSALATSVRR